MSREVKSVYFYNNSVILNFDSSVANHSVGLAYITYCICNGINDIDIIALNLIDKFKILEDLDKTKKTILSYTIEDDRVQKAFTLDSSEANMTPGIQGAFEKKFPQLLHIELTGKCNFMCEHCYKNAMSNGKNADFAFLEEKIYTRLKGIVPVVHFTGGEATLHKDFEEIVELFSDGYILQLTTNGSRITSFPIDVFKKFQSIDVSLYGLSANDYEHNTGSAQAFNWVTKGCMALKAADIGYRTTLVVNNNNWHQMEDYVRYAIDIGAESFGFALPMTSGKILNTTEDKWHLSKDTKREIYRTYRFIYDKYKDKIQISEWYRHGYSDMWKSYPVDDMLRCGAGRSNWWMSENFTFRPCAFLPDEYLNLNYDDWYSYIVNQYKIDWPKARNNLELFASNNDLDITDLCTIFRK